MTPQVPSIDPAQARWIALGEWILVSGLALTFGWTTLCLGGYLAGTMVVTSWAVFGLAALGGLLWTVRRGGEPVAFNRAALLPVPFLLYALASVLWLSPAKWLAWREWLLWLQMWLVFLLALHFGRGRRHAWALAGTFVALGLAGVAMAAYQRFVDPTWLMLGRTQAEQFFGRSSGMFGIPNSLAGLLEIMVPVCLALLFSRHAGAATRLACGWLGALFLFAIVLTGSRGGWIGLGLALMCWPLLAARNRLRGVVGAMLIAVLAAGGLAALFRFSENARMRIEPFLEGKFEASRPLIWKAGWRIWLDHPWVGSGAASYNVLFDQHRPRGFLHNPDWAHNEYLNTLSDYGAAGLALWLAAGGGLLWLGWKAVRRARREAGMPAGGRPREDWRMGLLVGLLAYAFHLGVDFHTKIPALAFAAALAAALLLRDEPGLIWPLRIVTARAAGLALAAGALLLAAGLAAPLYRAEALRFDARRDIDRQAAGRGDLRDIIPRARGDFSRAVLVDPANGQAWSDLAYAIESGWLVEGGDLVAVGRQAEAAAGRALALCPVNAEFWVRKGIALDMQARQNEGEECFLRAVELAPNSAAWWYHYAYHLSVFPSRKSEALEAVAACLALDPSNSAGIALRQQLVSKTN